MLFFSFLSLYRQTFSMVPRLNAPCTYRESCFHALVVFDDLENHLAEGVKVGDVARLRVEERAVLSGRAWLFLIVDLSIIGGGWGGSAKELVY